ncbi:Dabb family protein [Amycolatopsis pithecellobii]|uniref:Dabb family protein n=1 Tax=Amycolatopsis pithecellobii TaxID=664692 RepID=A0A6N7YVK6_9PSEU|nr:Dabb family protein [Amycolatopsis pithecellobii]MTD52903.1 Dabb family protein [Amycolatopsis pithecellobii]
MIYHSIRLSFKPGVSAEKTKAAFDQWHKMAKEIPAVQFYCIGRDIGGEYEYGAMFALKDIEGYKEFVMHPAGRETDLVGLPLVQNIVSMDLTDDPDPEIAEKIHEIHRVRFERDPDVLELVNNLSYSGSGIGPA